MSEFDISKLPKERRDALLRAEEYAARRGISIPRKKTNTNKVVYRTNTTYIPKVVTKKVYVPKYVVKEMPQKKEIQELDKPLSSSKRDRLLELVYRVVMKENLGFSYGEIAKQLENEGWDVKTGKISSREIIKSLKSKK